MQELFNITDDTAAKNLESVPFKWTGETQGWLINGKTISNYGAVDPSSKALDVIHVEPCKKYRLRFIGATTLSYASLGLENHTDLKVIEADGGYTKPYSIDVLQLGAGQRFSTLLETMTCDELKELGKLDYYLQIESRDRPTVATNYAVLRYSNSCGFDSALAKRVQTNENPAEPPIKLPPTISGFLDYKLKPLEPNNMPSASEVTRRIIINVQQIADKYIAWQDDNVTWTDDSQDPVPHTTPTEPYLVSLYKNQSKFLPDYKTAVAHGGLDPKTNTFPAKMGEVVDIVFQQYGEHTYDGSSGGGLDTHPWHAHGKHYYDIGGGDGVYDPHTAEERLQGTQPVRRDTTMLHRYNATTAPDQKRGWRAWRLRIEDPGVWMIHCHTLQHMIMGMQTAWVFGDAQDILSVPKPEVDGYLTYGGDVYGNSSHAPRVLHFSEAG